MDQREIERLHEVQYRSDSAAQLACFVLTFVLGIAALSCLLLLPGQKPLAWSGLAAAFGFFVCGTIQPRGLWWMLWFALLILGGAVRFGHLA